MLDMVVRCKICGSRDVDLRIGNMDFRASPSRTYCSKECQLIGDYNMYLFSTIMFFILPPMQPFAFYYLYKTLKAKKVKRERNKQTAFHKKMCYYCGKELEKLSHIKEKAVCMHCGNLVHFCDLCQTHILFEEDTLQIEPCGHIFHKDELLEWSEKNRVCPKCAVKIEFVDFQPE